MRTKTLYLVTSNYTILMPSDQNIRFKYGPQRQKHYNLLSKVSFPLVLLLNQ
jgi:hypothetical protein